MTCALALLGVPDVVVGRHRSARDDHSFHTSHIPRKVPAVEELAPAETVVRLGDTAEIVVLSGPKRHAKTDRADARLLRAFATKRGQVQHLFR